MKQYYEVYYSIGLRFKRGELVVISVEDYCENWYSFLAGKEEMKCQARFKHHMGTKRYDFIGTATAVLNLISDKFLNVLEVNKFTGWDTYPVHVSDKKGNDIPGYHGLIVPGRCGPIIEDWSEEFYYTAPSGIRMKAWRGLYFDPKTSDDSDFVVPEGTGFIIVREPVKIALEKAKITNIEFTRLTEFVIDYREVLS